MPNNLDVIKIIRSCLFDKVQGLDLSLASDVSSKFSNGLKFENRDDHMKFGSCLYTYEDSAMAIRGFISSAKLKHNLDIEYLRLFGVLNAAYLQLGVLERLVEITKTPNKKEILASLKEYEIIQCRNMLAAHTVSFKNNNQLQSITIEQASIGGSFVRFTVNETSERFSYDLIELLQCWSQKTRSVLIEICEKFIETTYKQDNDRRILYLNRLNEIKNES